MRWPRRSSASSPSVPARVLLHCSSESLSAARKVASGQPLDGDPEARMPGGESYADVLERYQPVLEDIAAELGEDEDVVVVSHGAAIRVVTTHACGVDPDFAYSGYMPNCRFTVMEPQGKPFGQWTLKRWADTDV